MTSPLPLLPPDITVFERGWLSSNNILIRGAQSTALVDSGYATHAAQTVALIRAALAARKPVWVIVNNKAEGSSPLTIKALAEALLR